MLALGLGFEELLTVSNRLNDLEICKALGRLLSNLDANVCSFEYILLIGGRLWFESERSHILGEDWQFLLV